MDDGPPDRGSGQRLCAQIYFRRGGQDDPHHPHPEPAVRRDADGISAGKQLRPLWAGLFQPGSCPWHLCQFPAGRLGFDGPGPYRLYGPGFCAGVRGQHQKPHHRQPGDVLGRGEQGFGAGPGGGRCGAGQPLGGRGALHPHGGDLVLHSEGIIEHFGELRQAGEQHPAYPQDSAGPIAGERGYHP